MEALYDVFVDNDDRSKLNVWVNRDYKSLRALVARRRSLRHTLEKEELRILRLVNKRYRKCREATAKEQSPEKIVRDSLVSDDGLELDPEKEEDNISSAFEIDCRKGTQLWLKYLKPSAASQVSLVQDKDGKWQPASMFGFWKSGEKKKAPKIAWLQTEIARLTIQIDKLLPKLDDEEVFPKQNSAFIQFDRQMAAHMACSLVSHSKAGRMAPRFVEVAPHEIIWSNMGVTSLGRFIRTCTAIVLFTAMLFLWAIPAISLGFLSQLGSLGYSVSWLRFLQKWPSYAIGLISGKPLYNESRNRLTYYLSFLCEEGISCSE